MNQRFIADLLHPVRMHVMQKLAAKTQWTKRQLGMAMPDIPQASLYRYLKAMVHDNILELVAETKVRGTVERACGIKKTLAELDAQGAALEKSILLNLFFQLHLCAINRLRSLSGSGWCSDRT
jgi:hypothetical protein